MRTVVAVLFAALAGSAAGCGGPRVEPTEAAPGGAQEPDRVRLLGLWGIESWDPNPTTEGLPPDEAAKELEKLKKGRMRFDGDRLTVKLFETESRFLYTLDTTRNPKVLSLIALDADEDAGRPGTSGTGFGSRATTLRLRVRQPVEQKEWIYKFDGDTLVIAFSKGGPRPTDFKPRLPDENGGVNVFRLKHLEAPPRPPAYIGAEGTGRWARGTARGAGATDRGAWGATNRGTRPTAIRFPAGTNR